MKLTINYIATNSKDVTVEFEVDNYAEAVGYISDIEPIDLSNVKTVNITINLED